MKPVAATPNAVSEQLPANILHIVLGTSRHTFKKTKNIGQEILFTPIRNHIDKKVGNK